MMVEKLKSAATRQDAAAAITAIRKAHFPKPDTVRRTGSSSTRAGPTETSAPDSIIAGRLQRWHYAVC
jgi:hypothetical protein